MRTKPITAEELLARLEADPEYRDRQARAEKGRLAREEKLDAAEEPLVNALRSVGVSVASVWDLVNTRAKYTEALPTLLEHLARPYPVEIREGIARSLAVRESRHAWNQLVEHYRLEHDPRVHEGLAIVLAEAAHEQVFDQVVMLMTDPKNGDDRIHLLRAVKRIRHPRAQEVIQGLASDPLFQYEVEKYLRGREKRRRHA